MNFDTSRLKWIRAPKQYAITDNIVEITTMPGTDLWQRTYYHFRNDNAPVLQVETEEKFFSFVVKTDFTGAHHRFDQCGIVMYLDSENWLKGSVEYENEKFQHLGSVVTNNGYSDWATTAIPAQVKTTRVVILNAKEHEPTRKGAERFNRIYFFVFVWPEKITETG